MNILRHMSKEDAINVNILIVVIRHIRSHTPTHTYTHNSHIILQYLVCPKVYYGLVIFMQAFPRH